MPRSKGTGKGSTDRFNIRLDRQTAAYYRTQANVHGISMSEFLRQMLVQGVIAETVNDIAARLKAHADEIHARNANCAVDGVPESLMLSVYTSEALLTAIVEQRDVQELYAAQNRAKAKLQRQKESGHGESSGK